MSWVKNGLIVIAWLVGIFLLLTVGDDLPRWVWPALAAGYIYYYLSKQVDALEKRITYLEENTVHKPYRSDYE